MNPTPFPWNPNGFIPNSVAHLFRPPEPKRKATTPPPPPGSSSQTCLKKSRPGRAGQISKARI